MSVADPQLVALRLPLDDGPPLDAFGLAGRDGILWCAADRVMVGVGRALTLELPAGLDDPAGIDRATEALAAVPCDDRVDSPVAAVVGFGALPFDRSESTSLVVPEAIFGRDASGAEWVTVLAPSRSELPTDTDTDGLRAWLQARSTPSVRPTGAGSPGVGASVPGPRIEPLSSDGSFEALVAEALAAIDRHEVDKVVLARQVDVTMAAAIDVEGLLRRWHELEPTCTVFSFPTGSGQFVGASPELLVERNGASVFSRPLAGTTDRSGSGSRGGSRSRSGSVLPPELLRSAKDGTEHRLVVEAIEQVLGPICSDLSVPAGPDLVHLHNITHLGTSVRGTLASGPDGSLPSVLHLVAALHPTPAVGGVPSPAARSLISRLEPQSRGRYAGPVGYVDARGDGRWMLGIRSLAISGSSARLAAGVGIVPGSDPVLERVETNLKFTAVFDALAPGVRFTTAGLQSGDRAAG